MKENFLILLVIRKDIKISMGFTHRVNNSDVDPDADPDADPDPDPDPVFVTLDPDPESAYHADPDPDPLVFFMFFFY